MTFVLWLQTLRLIDFSKMYQLKDLGLKNKVLNYFYECCNLTKKVYLLLLCLQVGHYYCLVSLDKWPYFINVLVPYTYLSDVRGKIFCALWTKYIPKVANIVFFSVIAKWTTKSIIYWTWFFFIFCLFWGFFYQSHIAEYEQEILFTLLDGVVSWCLPKGVK